MKKTKKKHKTILKEKNTLRKINQLLNKIIFYL